MTRTSENRLAGALNRIVIPSQALGSISEVANFLAGFFNKVICVDPWMLSDLKSLLFMIWWVVWQLAIIQQSVDYFSWKISSPSLCGYCIWNMQTVLQCLESIGSTATLSLKFLIFKLVMLRALIKWSHSADLASLQLDQFPCQFRPEVVFLPATLAK